METGNAIWRRTYRKLTAVLGTLTLLCERRAVTERDGRNAMDRTEYRVVDLGTLGGTWSGGWGINNRGWVSGIAALEGDGQSRAFLWRKGVMIDLGTLGGPNSFSFFPLNDNGMVTGGSETSSPDANGEDFCGFGTHMVCLPFVWKRGVMTALPTLGGTNGSAFGINSRGQAVGEAEINIRDATCLPPQVLAFKPIMWERGEAHELPTIPGDPDGAALAINDRGEAVGWSGTCAPGYGQHETFLHALVWRHGAVADLGNLGGSQNNVAVDINNQGHVIGHSNLPGDITTHGFLWWKGTMIDLGTLPGDSWSDVSDINEKGQIVGASQDSSGTSRAFLWQHGAMTDLNSLIPADSPLMLTFGGSINVRAEITGVALLKGTSELHAFLATPCGHERFETLDGEDEIWAMPLAEPR